MSNPWGRIGSWAAEAELEEYEEREQAAAAAPASGVTGNNDLQSFPSLKEAVKTKPKKKKMPLSEFYVSSSSSGGSSASRAPKLTPDEMLLLPTGPKQRSSDEYYSGGRLGGGFVGYDAPGAPPGRREGDFDGSWGGRRSYGGFEDDRRGPPRRGPDFDIQPSRADEVDDWGAWKRAMPPPPGMDTGRVNRYGTLGGGSKADEVDNWNQMKNPVQSPPPSVGRSNTFGSGFRDSGFDSDRWRRGVERESDLGGRRRLVLDPPRGERAVNEQPPPPPVVKTNKPNPFGQARPREEILAEKGLDWKKIDLEIEAKKNVGSRPTSSQGSRPSSAQSGRSENTGLGIATEVVVKPRPKVNPFGDAKPREVVLGEKGKDWRKIDLELEHRGVDREDTEAEKALKEEIENLKKELEKQPANNPSQEPGADQSSLCKQIQLKERDLEILIRELDDKVRFGQKAVERPGSGAGRFGSFSDRPSSRASSIDDARSVEFIDRPRSRGQGDVWTRPGDDRRGSFHGGRDRGGFLGSRDYDRARPRDGW